jgi:exodeoxyribonuclease VII large subunit
MQNKLHQKGELFVHLIEQLQLVSPLATIARGYSVTRNANGALISRVAQVQVDDELTVQVSDGHINAVVIKR